MDKNSGGSLYGVPGTGLAGTVGMPPGSEGTAGSGLAGSVGATPVPGTVGSWLGRPGVGAWLFAASREEPFAAEEFDDPFAGAGSVWVGVTGADGEAAVPVTDGLGAVTVGAGAAGMPAGDVGTGVGAVVSLVGWKIRTTVWPTLLRKSSLEAATAPAPSPIAPTTAAPTTKPMRRCRLRRCISRLATLEAARRMAPPWVGTTGAGTPEADAR